MTHNTKNLAKEQFYTLRYIYTFRFVFNFKNTVLLFKYGKIGCICK